VVEACTGVNIAVMVGGFPRKEGMERKDVMSKKCLYLQVPGFCS
jgi:malate/lactate dehydrogenase